MNKRVMIGMASAILALAGVSIAQAQSAYSNAVMSLDPVAYWPLSETTVPAGVYVATNLGSAQASGNGYYNAWWTNADSGFALTNVNNIVHSQGGIAGDSDTALQCGGTGQYFVLPRSTGGLTNTAVTLAPPFSVEFWVFAHSVDKQREILVEGGNNVQAGPDFGNALGQEGIEFGLNGTHFYWKTYDGPGVAGNSLTSAAGGILSNTWHHVVLTLDAGGTVKHLYVDGVATTTTLKTKNAIGAVYMPDFVSPMILGNGNELGSGNTSVFDGSVDELAVYNFEMDSTAVANHYNTGINPAPTTSYQQTVLGDGPTIYLRLDEPIFTAPSLGSLPVAANLGSLGASANGLYQPGTVPGAPGPAFTGFGSLSNAVALSFNGGVDVGGGALPAELNPTGTQPLTVMTWFRGNPADGGPRLQDLVSHGTNSYRIGLDLTPGNLFNPGAGPQLAFTNVTDLENAGMDLNDGQWHMAAGVSDGTNEYLYLDGLLVKSNASVASITGNPRDLILGGDPYFLGPIPGAGTGSKGGLFYDGSIAHVAFFTNALSSAQIQQVFSAANVPPVIHGQPSPSDLISIVGTNVSFATTVSGSSPINYQWYSTNGTPVSGQTGPTLNFPNTTVDDSGGYFLIAANGFGSATSSIVNLTVFGPPVVTDSTPSDVQVFAGTSPTLNVTVVGTPPFTYQWSTSGTNITDATNSSLVVGASQLGATTYIAEISNANGNAFVTNTVTVLPDPTAPYPLAVLADHPIAYYRLDEQNGTTAYDYAGGNNAFYTNVTFWVPGYSPSSDPNELAAEFGDVPQVNANNDYAGNVPGYLNFETNSGNGEFSVEAWVMQYLTTAGNGIVTLGSGGADQFLIDAGATGNTLRFVVRNAAGVSSAANSGKAIANDGRWHHVVGVCDEAGGHIFLYMDGVQIATAAITPGSGIMATTVPLSIGARESTNNPPDNYDFQFLGAIDDVAIYNQPLSLTQVRNHYFSSGAAPVITKLQPVNASGNENGSITFTVTATGTAPVTYQWSDNVGNPIPSATNATLTLTDLQLSQAGNYTVTVTDPYGFSTTNASLTVNTGAPVLSADIQPTNIVSYAGTTNTLFVTVAGTEPLMYQWLLNGSIIPDATNASYNFAALAGTNNYSVTVSNSFGGLESGTATVAAIVPVFFNTSSYDSSLKITFGGFTQAGTLTNFPVLVRLSTNVPGFSYSQFASPNGADLEFGAGTNTQALPYEIEQWNPAGESLVWVQVPLISSTNDFITAYWGNPAQTEPAASNTNGAVWRGPFSTTPEFDLVWHLNQSGFPFTDSTLQFPATNGGPGTAATGIVGAGLGFNGTGTFLNAGNINLSNSFTLSTWVNISPTIGNIMTIWASKPGSGSANGFAMNVNNFNTTDGALRFITGNGANSLAVTSPGGSVSFGQWHLVTATVDTTANTARVFVDGTEVTSTPNNILANFSKTNNVILGVAADGFFSFDGTMDEARVENGTRSANWIWASWATVATNSNFTTYSTVASTATPPVNLGFTVTGQNVQLHWTAGTLQSADQVEGPYSDVAGALSPYTVPLDKPHQFYRLRVP